jgi:hypothetical protein
VRQNNGAGYLKKYDGYFEDWVFWIDLVRSGYRGQVIEEPLIRYRFHNQSLSTNFNSRTSFRRKPGYDQMLEVLKEDRRPFFYDRTYLRELDRTLNRRTYIKNARVNLASPSDYKQGATPGV